MSRSPSPTEPPAIDGRLRAGFRLEATLLAIVVLVGLGLRALRPGAMAVEHFDEGVYASNLYCGHLDPPFAYPMRHLYAPPLFPAMLEWAQILAGPAAVMWVNVALGSLMVLAVWWTTRCWFGPAAAIAAALLAATSEYHIAFSRMALTDVPLSLLMLLGVFAGWKAILTGRPVWIATAGLVAGLAWCVKYNGWLTLAVTGAGTAGALLVPKLLLGNALATKLLLGGKKTTIANCTGRESGQNDRVQNANCKFKLMGGLVRWGLTAAIAGLVFWGFVLRDLGPVGGYAAVARNHAGYFVGLGGWWSGLLRQGAAHDLLMGWPSVVGIAAAWLACAWAVNRSGDRSLGFNPRVRAQAFATIVVIAVVLMAFGVLLTVSGLLSITALAGFVGALRQRERGDTDAGSQLAAWMLLAWFVGLLVSVPLYYPYPRLSVPWVVVCWPLAGAAMAATSQMFRHGHCRQSEHSAVVDSGSMKPGTPGHGTATFGRPYHPVKKLARALLLTVLLAVTWFVLDQFFGPHAVGHRPFVWPRAWRARDHLKNRLTSPILAEIRPVAVDPALAGNAEVSAIVYVAGDPAVFYQLSVACRIPGVVFLPIASAEGLRPTAGIPTFLVTHVAAGDRAPSRPNMSWGMPYTYPSSDMVLLDRVPATELENPAAPRNEDVRLYWFGYDEKN